MLGFASCDVSNQVLSLLEGDVLFPPKQKVEQLTELISYGQQTDSRTMKYAVGLNMAACQLQLGAHRDVIGICSAVGCVSASLVPIIQLIEQDDSNPKVFYRRGQALEAIGEYEEAIKDYECALALNPVDAVCFHVRFWKD